MLLQSAPHTQNDIQLTSTQANWQQLLKTLSDEEAMERINANLHPQQALKACLEILIMQAELCWGEEKQTDSSAWKRLLSFVEAAKTQHQPAFNDMNRIASILGGTSNESSRVYFLQWIGRRQRASRTCVSLEQIR